MKEEAPFTPLGDCVATDASACTVTPSSPALGMALPDGAMNGVDAQPAAPGDGGSCGAIDQFLSSTAVGIFPGCVGCISASPCCTGDSVCSMFTPCAVIVMCVSGNGCQDSTCVDICESQAPAGSTDFAEFAQCVSANCPTQCPALSPLGGDP